MSDLTLITGGAGFIGSNYASRVEKKSGFLITFPDRDPGETLNGWKTNTEKNHSIS